MRLIATLLWITVTRVYTLPIGKVVTGFFPPSTAVLTPLENLGDNVDKAISAFAQSKSFSVVTPFPDSGRKTAVLEQKSLESLPIKFDDKYGQLQNFVGNLVNAKPVVDTIEEHEKYGNDGEHFRSIATKLVGSVEGISNALNVAAELPFTAVKHFGKSISASFNTVGSKLVGLSQ